MEYSIFPTKKAADKWASENISGSWFIQKVRKDLMGRKSYHYSWKLSYRESDIVQFPFYKEDC